MLSKQGRVACECNRRRAWGSYTVDGDWLIVRSTLGDHRVRLGLADPRKLAFRARLRMGLRGFW